MTEQIEEASKNKFYIIAAVGVLVTLLAVSGISYAVGAQSKNDRLEACHKALSGIRDVVSYDGEVTTELQDNVDKCDPTFAG